MKVKVLNAQTQIEVRIIDLQDFLARSGECLMGRSPSSGLVLESSDVSRLHGKFVVEQGQYYFYDLGSANGSLVNGAIAQANHGYLLRSGDIVRIGEYVLMMQAPNNLEDLPATVIGDPNATVVGGLAFGAKLSGLAAAEERIPEPVELVGVVSDEMFAEPDTGLEDLTDSLEFDEDGIEDAIADQPIDELIEDETESEIVENETVDEAIEEDEFIDEIVESETINDDFVEEETIDEYIDYEFVGDRAIENETVDELTDSEDIDELEEETIDEVDNEIIDDEIVDYATVDELDDTDDETVENIDELTDDKAVDELIDNETIDELEEEPIDEVDNEVIDDEIVDHATVDELEPADELDDVDDEIVGNIDEPTDDETIDEVDDEILDYTTVDELEAVDELDDAEDETVEDIAINSTVDEAVEEREYEEATVIQEITPNASLETQPETQPEIQPEILDPSEVITVLPDPWNDPSVVPGATPDVLASSPLDSPILESEPTVVPTNDSLSIPSVAEVEDLSDTTVIQLDDLVDIDLADEPADDGTVIQLTDLVDEPSVMPQPVPSSSLTESTELDAIAEEPESQAIAPSSEPESDQINHEIDTLINQLFDSEPPTIPGITLPTTDISALEEEELEEELEESISLIDLSLESEAELTELEEELLEEEVFEEELEESASLIDLPLEPKEELTEPEEELPALETNPQVIPSTASLEPAHSEILGTIQKKYIVLLAHDNQEAELIQLIESYQSFLSQCQTLTTPSLSNTLKRQIGFTVTQQTPALLQGGYQSVNSLITAGKILAVLFARDFLTPQQTQSNDDALSRSCNVYGVLFASNLPTAEALIHSLQTKVTAAQ